MGSFLKYLFYSSDHIDEMVTNIKRNDIKNNVTISIRAGPGANSLVQLQRLCIEVDEFQNKLNSTTTITLWSDSNDFIDIPKLRDVINSIGKERVYLDFNENLLEIIKSNSTGNFNDGSEPHSTGRGISVHSKYNKIINVLATLLFAVIFNSIQSE